MWQNDLNACLREKRRKKMKLKKEIKNNANAPNGIVLWSSGVVSGVVSVCMCTSVERGGAGSKIKNRKNRKNRKKKKKKLNFYHVGFSAMMR